MKRKLMMLIATVVMVAGLTACGSTEDVDNTTPTTDVTIEETNHVDDETNSVEDETPVVEDTEETTPVVEKPIYTELAVRDVSRYLGNISLPLIDGKLPEMDVTIADMLFQVPEGYYVTWDDLMANIDELAFYDETHVDGHVIYDLSYPGSPANESFEEWRNNEYAKAGLTNENTYDEASYKALVEEFINNYSVSDWLHMFDRETGDYLNGDSMSEETAKYLELITLFDNHANEWKTEYESYLNNPDNFILIFE